jgi:hypothetical protein
MMTVPSGISAASGATNSNKPQTVRNEATAPTRAPVAAEGRGSDLETSQGKTTIAETVVSKITGMATRQVNGVAGFGSGAARAMGAIRERIPGARASSSQGLAVEVGERQAAVDLTIVVEYGGGDRRAGPCDPTQRDRLHRADDRPRGRRGQHQRGMTPYP